MPATDALDIVILAAGKGTRMRSSLAKVLHPVGGKPLLGHVIDTASAIGPRSINVVIGHQGADVQAAFADRQISWVEQAEQLGTGHAVGEANKTLNGDGVVLVLYGDVPLVTEATMRAAVEAALVLFVAPVGYALGGRRGRAAGRGVRPDLLGELSLLGKGRPG